MHSSSSATSRSPTPRLAAVHARAAELLLRDVLADRRAHEVRPGERHRAAALDHRHEVGEPGDVGGARRARAHQRRDLRDDAARDDLLAEEVPGAGEQRADRLLDARAGGVEQPDERHALRQREVAQARDLQLAGHAHRAGHDREVVGRDGHEPPVDLAVAGDDAVGRRLLVLQAAHRVVDPGVDAELGERAVVDEQRDALARGQLARSCCLSIFSSPPPSRACARRSWRSSTSGRRIDGAWSRGSCPALALAGGDERRSSAAMRGACSGAGRR